MKKKETAGKGGMGFIGVLTLIFIVLKFTGNINWSWLWVLSPIWVTALLLIVFFGALLVIWKIEKGQRVNLSSPTDRLARRFGSDPRPGAFPEGKLAGKRTTMNQIDHFSYELGAADCFCEMVRAGVKQIALAHPCDTREARDEYLPYFEDLCQKYGVKLYVEDVPLLTDLFPLSMNQGKYNAIFYQEDSALDAYLALKAEKQAALEAGAYTPETRWDIAWRYGKLLSYTDQGIQRLLEQNQEKE